MISARYIFKNGQVVEQQAIADAQPTPMALPFGAAEDELRSMAASTGIQTDERRATAATAGLQ
jgi:hypothetical protein